MIFIIGLITIGLLCWLFSVSFREKQENLLRHEYDIIKPDSAWVESNIEYIWGLRIFVVENQLQCMEACRLLESDCSTLKALGFDCEWVTESRVALLQLASPLGLCCLFRLNKLQQVPDALAKILRNEKIIKLGVGPLQDSKLLFNSYSVEVRSTLDLRYLYPDVNGGLGGLAYNILGKKLDKNSTVRFSNWEKFELTENQKKYAAEDALVAIEIFKIWLLRNRLCNVDHSEEMKLEICKFEFLQCYKKKILHLLNKDFISKLQKVVNNAVIMESALNSPNLSQKIGYTARKTPLYHNCFLHAPDGELLCSCDKRKADWYVERGLAKIISTEPYSVKLLFEPTARPGETNGGRYYQQLKQNRCVVCGASECYIKHNVVPKEYRKHLPEIMKNHQSHDVVLLCLSCHQLASLHNSHLRKFFASICDAPITDSKVVKDNNMGKLKNMAKALLKSSDKIPPDRKTFLENEIKKFYNVDNLTIDLLQKTSNLEHDIATKNYKSHGIKVVDYYKKKPGGLIEFEKTWRKYFLETMKPQYLPALWSVDHNHSRVAAATAANS